MDPRKDHSLKECDKAEAMLWEAYKADTELYAKVQAVIASDPDCEFLGFMGAYYHLSLIIPKDRTVYDLGCYHGFQSWFFREHHKYIGVDAWKMEFLELENTQYIQSTIELFLKEAVIDKTHFAICNYVGGTGAQAVREKFTDLYVFYPHSRNPVFPIRGK